MVGCPNTEVGMMYSLVNPVPDVNDNAGMTDPDLKRSVADLFVNSVKPVYLAVSIKKTDAKSCPAVYLYNFPIGN